MTDNLKELQNRITLIAGIATGLIGLYGTVNTLSTIHVNKQKDYVSAVQSEEKYWDDKNATFTQIKQNKENDAEDAYALLKGLQDEIKYREIPDFRIYDTFTFGTVIHSSDIQRLHSKKTLLGTRLEKYMGRLAQNSLPVQAAQTAEKNAKMVATAEAPAAAPAPAPQSVEVNQDPKSVPSAFMDTTPFSYFRKNGLRLEIFWCQGAGNQSLDTVNYSKARDVFIALKDLDMIGTIKLKPLLPATQVDKNYKLYVGQGVSTLPDPGEEAKTEALRQRLASVAIPMKTLGVRSTNVRRIEDYITIFVCQ